MGMKEKMLEVIAKTALLPTTMISTAILGIGKIIEERREYRIVNGKTQYRDFVTTYSDDSKTTADYTYGPWRDS